MPLSSPATRPTARDEDSLPTPTAEKPLYRVPEAMEMLSLGRSVIYELIRSGRLRTVKEGRTRLVPDWAIRQYTALLASEAGYNESEMAA